MGEIMIIKLERPPEPEPETPYNLVAGAIRKFGFREVLRTLIHQDIILSVLPGICELDKFMGRIRWSRDDSGKFNIIRRRKT